MHYCSYLGPPLTISNIFDQKILSSLYLYSLCSALTFYENYFNDVFVVPNVSLDLIKANRQVQNNKNSTWFQPIMKGKKQLGRAYLFPDVNDIAQERFHNVAKSFLNSHFQFLYPCIFPIFILTYIFFEIESLDNLSWKQEGWKITTIKLIMF